MTTRSKLKTELVGQYLDFGREFFDMVGITDKDRKKGGRALVATAEGKAADSSEAALRASFNTELLAEGKLMIRSLTAAFASAAESPNSGWSSVPGNQNERLDVEAHRQPKQHKLPSGTGFPTY